MPMCVPKNINIFIFIFMIFGSAKSWDAHFGFYWNSTSFEFSFDVHFYIRLRSTDWTLEYKNVF